MKSFTKIFGGVVAALGIGFLAYQGLVTKTISTQQMLMGLCLVAMLALSIYNASLSRANSKNSPTYRQAYAEFIGDSFLDDKKLEQKLYVALENLGRKKYSAAVKRLDELLPLCRSDDERFTCHVFKGMAYSRDNEPGKAAESYTEALRYKESTTACSNLGLCLSKTGDDERAEEAYCKAILLDEHNAYALNNLAQLYIARKDYESGLRFATKAFEANDKLVQAVNAIAICHGVMGNEEKFRSFLKLASAMGSNGKALVAHVEELRQENA